MAGRAPVEAAALRRILAAQRPAWADLPIRPAAPGGTDNAIFRLGDELCLRVPLGPGPAALLQSELAWLPRLRHRLPIEVPEPVAALAPGPESPWPIAVYRWLEGESAAGRDPRDIQGAGGDLGRFIAALQRVDLPGGPPTGPDQTRGRPLAVLDGEVRGAIRLLAGAMDAAALAERWEEALRLPPHEGRPVWLHADIHPANLLLRHGRLHAVLDFGTAGVGDPACDLMAAWTVLTAQDRPALRAEVAADDATWARGRAWALAWALIAHAYYRTRDHVLGPISGRTLQEILADRD